MLLGPIPYEEVPSYLSAIDIAVLPDSTSYIYPGKLLEYGASGTAVVAPAREVIKEIIVNGTDGILFQPGSPVALEEALKILINRPNLRKELGINFRQKIEKAYSWESVWAKVLESVAEVCGLENRDQD